MTKGTLHHDMFSQLKLGWKRILAKTTSLTPQYPHHIRTHIPNSQIPLNHLFHAVHSVSKTLTYSGSHLKNTPS